MWHVRHLLGSDVSPNFRKDSEDPGGACLSLSYTSNKQFSKPPLLAVIGLPWPMTDDAVREVEPCMSLTTYLLC